MTVVLPISGVVAAVGLFGFRTRESISIARIFCCVAIVTVLIVTTAIVVRTVGFISGLTSIARSKESTIVLAY